MIESDVFVQALQDIGVEFFTGVPDPLLAGLIEALMERRQFVPATREDEALAMASGAYLGGKVPAVFISTVGLGAASNILASHHVPAQHPCVILLGWRGAAASGAASMAADGPECAVAGSKAPAWLDQLGLPHRTLSVAGFVQDLRWAAETFMRQRVPVVLLLPKGVVKGLQP
ncbi:MAG: thiamine pyrophosphate-binding protein [Nitrospiraceae bacterium]